MSRFIIRNYKIFRYLNKLNSMPESYLKHSVKGKEKERNDQKMKMTETTERRKLTKKELLKEVVSYAVLTISAILFVMVLKQKVIVNAQVPSGLMESTVMTGDRIIINRLAYQFGEPKRGDIILFPYPDNEKEDYLKRIIGRPGETLEIRNGKVYLNGSNEALEEPYLKEEPSGSFGPYQIPEGYYFVMGDNRMDSWDSRFWEHTCVRRDKIAGKAVFRYFPNPGGLY